MAPTKKSAYIDGNSLDNPIDLTGVTSGRVIKKEPGTPKKKKTPKLTAPAATPGTACQACRKGKARCVRVKSCERCLSKGLPCPSEADGPNAADEILLMYSTPKACARCRRLKAACVRKARCVRCEKKGVDCVVG